MRHSSNKHFTILLTTLFFTLFLCSCYISDEYHYYFCKDNYVSAVGTVVYICESENHDALYLTLEDVSPEFDDVCFEIVGDNMKLMQENGSVEKLREGIQIEFVSAPKYFGDGYFYPIVAVSVEGDTLLAFEDGFKNYLAWIIQ